MSKLDDLIELLGSDLTDGYGPSPIPSPIDEKVRELIRMMSRRDQASRSSLTERHGFVLTGFAERMATLAVRTGEEEPVREGLTALSIAAKLLYYKEILPILSLLARSAAKLHLDLRKMNVPAEQPFLQTLEDFLARDEKDRSIELMGYFEAQDAGGFRYSRTW